MRIREIRGFICRPSAGYPALKFSTTCVDQMGVVTGDLCPLARIALLQSDPMRTKAPQDLYVPAPRLNQLHILQQIALDTNVTQAEMAERCALSVAMVNNYMKELSTRGYLEYHRKNSKSVSYHLTAAGREAVDATRDALLQELARRFRDAKEQVLETILSRHPNSPRRVVLYGTGALAEIALHALASANINIVAVCSGEPAEVGSEFCGRKIIDASQIRFLDPDAVVIALDPIPQEIASGLDQLRRTGEALIHLGIRIPHAPAPAREIAVRPALSAAAAR